MKYHLTKTAVDSGCTFEQPREGDAGYDIASAEVVVVKPGEQRLISTGLYVQLPENTVGLLRDRSGFSSQTDCHVFAGVIDSSYRGEIKVLLKNLSPYKVAVFSGQRIAQMVVLPVLSFPVKPVALEDLTETVRGEGGFGSTDLTEEEKARINARLKDLPRTDGALE